MNNSGLQDLLEKRCKRSIAILLSLKERELDPYLPSDAAQKYRKAVMDQLNDFCSIATDILESASRDVVWNDLWLQKLDAIHAVLVEGD